MTRYRAASPFEKGGLRGIFIFSASQIPPTPLSQRGNNSVMKYIVKRHILF